MKLCNPYSTIFTFFCGNTPRWNEKNSRRCNFVLGCSVLTIDIEKYKLEEQKDGTWIRAK